MAIKPPPGVKLTRQFQTVIDENGREVQMAKFGRTAVMVWKEEEIRKIWRGDPKIVVAEIPSSHWNFSVGSEMTGLRATEECAKAEAEYRAWDSEANASHLIPDKLIHSVPSEQMAEDLRILKEENERIMAEFPADYVPPEQEEHLGRKLRS
jgi:hypothetical protein